MFHILQKRQIASMLLRYKQILYLPGQQTAAGLLSIHSTTSATTTLSSPLFQLILSNSYHTTIPLFKRKSGSALNEFPRRKRSKKQKKKLSQYLEEKKHETKHLEAKVKKTKFSAMRKETKTEKFQEERNQLQEELAPQIYELLKPTPNLAKENEIDPNRFLLEPDVEKILLKLSLHKEKLEDIMDPAAIQLYSTIQQERKRQNLRIDQEYDQKFLAPSQQALKNTIQLPSTILKVQDISDANYAIQYLIAKEDFLKASEMYDLLEKHSLPIEIETYSSLFSMMITIGDYPNANKVFNEIMTQPDITPTISIWEEKIRLLSCEKNLTEAMNLVEYLVKNKVNITVKGYNHVLEGLVKYYHDIDQHEKVMDVWLKMHERSGTVQLNAESFKWIIQHCASRGEFERAFFYFDELKGLNITPTMSIFRRLIRASARAPYWVNGYEDSISDALYLLEAHHVYPDVQIYNEIIEAYGLCGDAVSAEYYYWEMIRKDILPDKRTFVSLLRALAKSNSCTASTYRFRGRFFKLEDKPKTWKEESFRLIGPKRVLELFNAGLEGEVESTKGGRRMTVTLKNYLDENPDASKEVQRQISREARKIKLLNEQRRYLILAGYADEAEGMDSIDKHLIRIRRVQKYEERQRDLLEDFDDEEDDALQGSNNGFELTRERILDEYGIDVFSLKVLEIENHRLSELLYTRPNEELKVILPLLKIEERKRVIYNISYEKMKNFYYPKDGGFYDPFIFLPDLKGTVVQEEKQLKEHEEAELISQGEEVLSLPSSNRTTAIESNDEENEDSDSDELEEDESEDSNSEEDIEEPYEEPVPVVHRIQEFREDDPIREFMNRLYGELEWEPTLSAAMKREELVKLEKEEASKAEYILKERARRKDGGVTAGQSEEHLRKERIRNQIYAIETLDGIQSDNSSSSSLAVKKEKPHEINSAKEDPLLKLHREIDTDWDKIHYGRLLPPNFLYPPGIQKQVNLYRATLIMNVGLPTHKITRDEEIWNAFLSVFAEAGQITNSEKILSEMHKLDGASINSNGCESMIRMYVRRGEVNKAIALYGKAKKENIDVNRHTYGLLISSFTHHGMIVEALRVLEEAADKQIKIPERDIKHLRVRCEKLGIKHPDLPANPNEWVKDVKKMQRDTKNASERSIQGVRSTSFFGR